MIAERREQDEGLDRERSKILSKIRGYLRSNFPGESAKESPDAVKKMLMQVAADWCLNRGLRIREDDLKRMVDEGYQEHCASWQGREAGNDARGRELGAVGKAFSAGYGV